VDEEACQPSANCGGVAARNYEFRVHGRVTEPLRQAVDEFTDVQVVPAPPETLIYGAVQDQSQLHGLLMLLETLGLRIVAVHQIPALPLDSQRGDHARYHG
jgi:hypothetical protein